MFEKVITGCLSPRNLFPWKMDQVSLVLKNKIQGPNIPFRFKHNTWWRHQMESFPRCWSFVRGIHRSSVNSPLKSQWRGSLMFSLIRAWTNGWANHCDAGDLRRYRPHYDVTLMSFDSTMTVVVTTFTGFLQDWWNYFHHLGLASAKFNTRQNIKARHYLPFVRGIHRGRWIPLTKVQ